MFIEGRGGFTPPIFSEVARKLIKSRPKKWPRFIIYSELLGTSLLGGSCQVLELYCKNNGRSLLGGSLLAGRVVKV